MNKHTILDQVGKNPLYRAPKPSPFTYKYIIPIVTSLLCMDIHNPASTLRLPGYDQFHQHILYAGF